MNATYAPCAVCGWAEEPAALLLRRPGIRVGVVALATFHLFPAILGAAALARAPARRRCGNAIHARVVRRAVLHPLPIYIVAVLTFSFAPNPYLGLLGIGLFLVGVALQVGSIVRPSRLERDVTSLTAPERAEEPTVSPSDPSS